MTVPAAQQQQQRHNAPIGVFDSGLGGLTVVREILRHLPWERVVYVGDTAHVPYGGRSLDEVRGFAVGISRFLREQIGCKALVMACNISSAVARNEVQSAYPDVPVLGVIEPGARAAAARAEGGPIAVLATEGTVKSGAYARAIGAEKPATLVTSVACPLFVPLVEGGHARTPEAEEAARRYLDAARMPNNARVMILGCTHYPFLLPTLKKVAGPGTVFVDPAGETVRELSCVLTARALAAERRESGSEHVFYATGYPTAFAMGAAAFLGDVAAAPRRLHWREGRLAEDGSEPR